MRRRPLRFTNHQMDSDTSSVLILIAIVAAAILFPLGLIGLVALITLPAVYRQRRQWKSAAATLGLQCDRTNMWGVRGLPVRVFWQTHGQSAGRVDMAGVVLAGRYDMRGGRSSLRYTFCRAMLDPPLGLGLNVSRSANGAEANMRTGCIAFDSTFAFNAQNLPQAQRLLMSPVGDLFARAAQSGWQLSATDDFVQVLLGGNYFSQHPERQPEQLAAALDIVVACGQQLRAAHRNLQDHTYERFHAS
jgi:hypothetical protein